MGAGTTPDGALAELVEHQRLARLKYAYVRCVDTKSWDELEGLLTEDATASYGGGAKEITGAAAIVAWLREVLDDPGVHTSHRVTQPEIELLGPDEATGRWSLADTVIDTRFDITVRGAAFYEDRYVKLDGTWRIAHTGYRRLYEEIEPRASTEGLRLTASWWATDGRSELV